MTNIPEMGNHLLITFPALTAAFDKGFDHVGEVTGVLRRMCTSPDPVE
jgi:hypothetical protein